MNSQSAFFTTSNYNRSQCDTGIVHIGLGAFHRAHQAYFIDAMMQKTGDLSWGIAGVNLRMEDRSVCQHKDDLKDGYILKTVSRNGEAQYHKVRSLLSISDWTEDAEQAECLLALCTVRLVTITVTESGYYLNENGQLDLQHEVIRSELTGETRKSLFAFLRAALAKRKRARRGALTILCCDNLRGNGDMLAKSFATYLKACNEGDLLNWVEKHITFPCTMVDRITPRPSDALKADIERHTGHSTKRAVMSEDFAQWVIQDYFAAERPPLDTVGAQFVRDVHPYEEAKVRILNGGHTSLAYLAVLSGHQTFDQAMSDPDLYEHFKAYQVDEVLPVLGKGQPIDLEAYLQVVIDRFRNEFIADDISRICIDGAVKFQLFVRPTILGSFANGIVPSRGIRSIASWYVFLRLRTLGRLSIPYTDHTLDRLGFDFSGGDVAKFADCETLWGEIPKKYAAFQSTLFDEIRDLERRNAC